MTFRMNGLLDHSYEMSSFFSLKMKTNGTDLSSAGIVIGAKRNEAEKLKTQKGYFENLIDICLDRNTHKWFNP